MSSENGTDSELPEPGHGVGLSSQLLDPRLLLQPGRALWLRHGSHVIGSSDMMDERSRFSAMVLRSAALKEIIAADWGSRIIAVVDAAEASLRVGGRLFFCGNGGSAADSQHLATELLIRLRGRCERPSLPAIALTLDSAALTAAGNDYGFDRIFERPLRGLGRRGDMLVGITTSGRSRNVVLALEAARAMGITTVGFLGGSGEPACHLCDHPLIVPDSETARIQECHIMIGHVILELLEDRLMASPIRQEEAPV